MKKIMACALALLLMATLAFAEIPKPSEDFWYLDSANVLSEETEGEIFFANQRLYDACGAEIVVVAVNSTGNLSTSDYAYELFNDWQIGKDTYLGMLLVMAIDDEDYYAMTGTKLENYLSAGELSEMLNQYLEPDFASGDYDAGARSFFEAAYAFVSDELNLNLSVADARREAQSYISQHTTTQTTAVRGEHGTAAPQGERGGSLMGYIIVIIILLIVFGNVRRVGRRRRSFMPPPPPPMHMHRPPMGPRPRRSPPPPMGGFGGPSRPPRNDNRGGFGGASRGGFSGGRSSGFSGGFGGASRHSGGGHGPTTRGGGAGRGR